MMDAELLETEILIAHFDTLLCFSVQIYNKYIVCAHEVCYFFCTFAPALIIEYV